MAAATSSPAEEPPHEAMVRELASAAFRDEPDLLDGEYLMARYQRVSDLTYAPTKPPLGKLLLTNYQLMYQPYDKSTYDVEPIVARTVPVSAIASVDLTDAGMLSRIRDMYMAVETKDGRSFRFRFNATSEDSTSRFTETCRALHKRITDLVFPDTKLGFFAFTHHVPCPAALDGWNLLDLTAEYRQMGIPNTDWRLCTANRDYSICSTYPSMFAVPSCVSDDELRAAALYRSRGRIPLLSYRRGNATISRAAQPHRGLLNRKCAEDERLVAAIAASNNGNLVIVDARPQVAALANAVMGAGYEHDAYARVEFLSIGNIHAVRDSFQRLCVLCAPPPSAERDQHYFAAVDSTGWLDHVQRVLAGSVRVAALIEGGHSVLVHCSDGWDRTSQLVTLAILLLDKQYRTLRGFAALIEREWVSAGHQFRSRSGHGQPGFWTGQCAPIFQQWLECVWHVVRQHPNAFEFNETLLVFLAEHVYSCRFGTFLFDCERERDTAQAAQKTQSIWTYVLGNAAFYTNRNYVPNSGCLRVGASMRHLAVWDAVFNRFHFAPTVSAPRPLSIHAAAASSIAGLPGSELSIPGPADL